MRTAISTCREYQYLLILSDLRHTRFTVLCIPRVIKAMKGTARKIHISSMVTVYHTVRVSHPKNEHCDALNPTTCGVTV